MSSNNMGVFIKEFLYPRDLTRESKCRWERKSTHGSHRRRTITKETWEHYDRHQWVLRSYWWKIELLEKIIVDFRADLEKVFETSIHFYGTIEKLNKNFSKQDRIKVQLELSELSFRPQPSQKNASNPLSEKVKEKHEWKAKLLAQRPIIQHIGIELLTYLWICFIQTTARQLSLLIRKFNSLNSIIILEIFYFQVLLL